MNPAENLAAYMQGSQAVDETGAPKRLYHATAADFSVFDPKKAAKNSGNPASRLGHFLAATPEAADLFSRKPDKFSQGTGEYKPGANIMPVHAAIKNPHVMSWKEFAGALASLNSMPDKKANKEVDAFRQQLIDAGHDGILVKGGWKPGQFLGSPEFSSDNWVAFDPTQIKSATGNQGTFDPSNPDITKRDGGDVEGYIPHDDKSRAKNLKAFHGKTPKEIKQARWYHGTDKDFQTFKSGKSGAIFLSQDPEFADRYAYGEGFDAPPRRMPKPNIMPVHVRAEKPFDYENKKHISALYEKLGPDLIFDPFLAHSMDDVRKGHWEAIENPKIQNAIKAMGHDSFFVNEDGVKNLGVYDPSQIKSATGNQGTFDPSNPDITKRDGGDVEGLEPSIDMSIDKQNNRLSAKAIDDWNKAIGHATFNIGDNSELDPQHVEVHEDYRKSGIAKKLYDHVARRGYKIIRSNDQTDAGHAFWNKHQGSNKVWRVNKEGGGALSENGITAYHGSPHDFEQFDINKIGTGEGAQSFGHGLYFAGNEDVAKDYRERLGKQEETSGETMADQYVIPPHFYKDISDEELTENMKEAAQWADKQIFDKGKMHYVFDDGSMLIHDDDEVRAVQKHPGHMYEVHIDAHPDHFLDWDEVLEDQTPHIKAALQRVADHDEAEKGYTDLHEHLSEPDAYTGAAFYHELANRGRDKEASEILNQMGIKGIRYKDAGSRFGNEKPSYNYVIFDHDNVAVKRKYARGGMVDEAA